MRICVNVCVCALIALTLPACDRPELPTAPTLTDQQRTTTPSNQSDVLKISYVKVGENLIDFTLAERPEFGLPADKGGIDWNGAHIYVYRLCDVASKKEQKDGTSYSNSRDSVTGKRTVVLKSIPTCPGNKVFMRLVIQPANSQEQIEFTYPQPGIVLLPPGGTFVQATSITQVPENGRLIERELSHRYISGSV
jgi:hypothetical protein